MIKETEQITPTKPYEEIPSIPRPSGMLKLTRNTAFLMLLLVCLASIHNQQLPDGRTVLTAVQSTVDQEWDESLGRITFVDNMMPQTLSVFFQEEETYSLSLPCNGTLVHLWETHAPYVSFNTAGSVLAIADGEVMSLSHDSTDQLSLRIRHENGLESVYYHLASTPLREGDMVTSGEAVGSLQEGHNLVLDVRRNGLSIDPVAYFRNSP
ncbi:MAG: M23 family metallopeptidase [Clostridia bacterium]|nr:M23 family metallopeptidase [Clostridia bacterium]